MFDFFKKNKPVETEKPQETKGFFSTEMSKGRRSTIEQRVTDLIFQGKEIPLPVVTLKDGTVLTADDSSGTFNKNLTGWYGGVPDSQLGWYGSQGFIGYQMCAVISQNWLVDKACTMPARDAVRKGYELSFEEGIDVDPEIIQAIQEADRRYKLNKNLIEFVRMGRIFGIRIAMFVVESPDPDYYVNPFNPDGVTEGTYKGISQIDPYWITPELDASAVNPASIDFYEPTWWRINGMRVHKSHLVIFRHSEPPDLLKPAYVYGGISVPQKIFERVYGAERVANEAPQLTLTKRATVIKTDVEKAVANQAAFEEKMTIWATFRDNYGIKIIGDSEEIQQFDTSLTDLDATIMTQYQLVAAAAEVPATKLLGTTPKGFNATGEYDEASYHEMLESIQENDLARLINRHHMLLMLSEIAPKFNIKPLKISVVFHPLDSPTAKELAETNKVKAETDSQLVAAGAIDGIDVRNRLIKDPRSGYSGIETMEENEPDNEENDETAAN